MSISKPFTPGHPPDEVSEAWLLMRSEDGDGGESEAVVLAIRVDDDWHEAADWKAESTLDSVHAEACWIVGWLPYAVPQPDMHNEKINKPHAAVAAIQFALETDEGLAFLRCWNEGNFDAIRPELCSNCTRLFPS